MYKIHELLRLPLKNAEKVVGFTSHYGRLYAVTDYGTVYLIETEF